MAKSSDTTRLEEVKTLLHQLQRIRSEPTNSNPQAKPEGNPSRALGRPRIGLRIAGTTLLFLAAAMAGTTLLFDKPAPKHPEPPTAAVQQPGSSEPLSSLGGTAEQHPESGTMLSLLQQAQQMMLSGDILGAREILMKSADSGPPDVALAVARSYDPNFLRSVTNPNAAPDIEQAALWYRRWHHAAVESGLVTDTLRLERILRSMR